MYIDNLLSEKIDEAAQEIMVHCVLDQRQSPPDYKYLQQQLKNLVEVSLSDYLDSQC